ncbi:glycosyltransferase family 4 protein [Microbispora maris]|uniref:glycosyltransferase family 4 protein n=1 Tax=Microbispora maris TaxID=3144104 RepID=UPI0031FDBF13
MGLLVDSDAYGGAEVYVRQLLRRLPPSIERHLVVAEPVAPRFLDLADRCASLTRMPLARGRTQASELPPLLRGIGADVWCVNLVDPAGNRAALGAACAAAPTVAVLHMPGEADGLRELYAKAAAVVTVSEEITGLLRDDLGLPADRVVHVRSGVDVPERVVRPARDGGPLRVGAVGRLTGQKGFDLLIPAVAELVRGGHRLTVEIAGEGRDHAALVRAAAGLPIRFAGFVRDVPAMLSCLDVFCLPSRREGLPLALLEAMAHGLPCVATDVGDVAAAVGDGALVVPPGDVPALTRALEALLADGEARRRLGTRARAVAVRRFDAAAMAETVARILLRIGGAP